MEDKYCYSCKTNKPLSEFPLRKRNPIGFRDASLHKPCKSCNAETARNWRKKNKGYGGSGRISKYPREDWPLMSAIRTRLREAIARINKFDKQQTDMDEQYLYDLFNAQGRKCALLGYDLSIERKHPLCLSLDQIEPSKGYVRGNVQWVTWVANRAKGDMTQDDFYRMCEIAVNYRKVQRLSNDTQLAA